MLFCSFDQRTRTANLSNVRISISIKDDEKTPKINKLTLPVKLNEYKAKDIKKNPNIIASNNASINFPKNDLIFWYRAILPSTWSNMINKKKIKIPYWKYSYLKLIKYTKNIPTKKFKIVIWLGVNLKIKKKGVNKIENLANIKSIIHRFEIFLGLLLIELIFWIILKYM